MVRLFENIKLLFPTQSLSSPSTRTSALPRHLTSANSSQGLSFSSIYSNICSNHCSRTHHTPGLTKNTSLDMRPPVHPKNRIPTIRVFLSTFLLAALASAAPTPSKAGHIYGKYQEALEMLGSTRLGTSSPFRSTIVAIT